jgi:hypothetical protein
MAARGRVAGFTVKATSLVETADHIEVQWVRGERDGNSVVDERSIACCQREGSADDAWDDETLTSAPAAAFFDALNFVMGV